MGWNDDDDDDDDVEKNDDRRRPKRGKEKRELGSRRFIAGNNFDQRTGGVKVG